MPDTDCDLSVYCRIRWYKALRPHPSTWDDRGTISLAGPEPESTLRRLCVQVRKLRENVFVDPKNVWSVTTHQSSLITQWFSRFSHRCNKRLQRLQKFVVNVFVISVNHCYFFFISMKE